MIADCPITRRVEVQPIVGIKSDVIGRSKVRQRHRVAHCGVKINKTLKHGVRPNPRIDILALLLVKLTEIAVATKGYDSCCVGTNTAIPGTAGHPGIGNNQVGRRGYAASPATNVVDAFE